jgi:hypothetical protein
MGPKIVKLATAEQCFPSFRRQPESRSGVQSCVSGFESLPHLGGDVQLRALVRMSCAVPMIEAYPLMRLDARGYPRWPGANAPQTD